MVVGDGYPLSVRESELEIMSASIFRANTCHREWLYCGQEMGARVTIDCGVQWVWVSVVLDNITAQGSCLESHLRLAPMSLVLMLSDA